MELEISIMDYKNLVSSLKISLYFTLISSSFQTFLLLGAEYLKMCLLFSCIMEVLCLQSGNVD